MSMQEYIEEAEQALLHTYNRYQIVLDKGRDVYLYDTDGIKYLDFVSGIGVFALGYGNKAYNDALKAQIDKLIHTSNYYYNLPAIQAAKKLKDVSGMDRVFFTNSGAEAIVGMSCGDGVQTVADNVQLPVYPANNTMFLGQVERVGMFNEYCHMCGDCVLGSTGGVCPITKCAKSLVNGPCGGQKNGKCEVNPENDCAWILIYKRLEALGQLDKLGQTRPDKGYAGVAYPRHINLREKKS